jgi:hypothetical protein
MKSSVSNRPGPAAAGKRSPVRALLAEYGIGAAFLAAAIFVPLYMLLQFQYASSTMTHDYWAAAQGSYTVRGGFNWQTLFQPVNEHIIALPRLFFWLNMLVGGGSNKTLGVFCWVVVLIQAFLMCSMLPERCRREVSSRVGVLCAIFVLSFTPAAIHNFLLSFSGAMWLTANCLTVAALFTALRVSPFAGFAFAALASLTYSTGIISWFALAAAAWWGPLGRRWTVIYGVTGLVGVVVHALVVPTPVHHPAATLDPLLIGQSFAVIAGSLLGWNPSVAVVFGIAAAVALLWLLYGEPRGTEARTAFWIALAVYPTLCVLQIAAGRAAYGGYDDAASISRYTALPGLMLAALSGLAIIRFGMTKPFAVALSIGLVISFVSAAPTVRTYRQQSIDADILGIGVRVARLDNPDGFQVQFGTRFFGATPELLRAMETTGHYPFNSSFRFDVGLLGKTIPAKSVRTDSAVVSGNLDSSQDGAAGLMVVTGWAAGRQGVVDQVVITDSSYKVIGAGRVGLIRRDINRLLNIPAASFGWQGFAKKLNEPRGYHVLARLKGQDGFYMLTPPLPRI